MTRSLSSHGFPLKGKLHAGIRFFLASLLALGGFLLGASSGKGTPLATPTSRSCFETDGLPADLAAQAEQIYAITRAHFIRLTNREVGRLPIRLRLVENPGGHEALRRGEKVLGSTVHHADFSEVRVGSEEARSFGRVLAHEITHVFVREAFGRAANRALSEGFAEYVASLSFGAEVRHDMRAAFHPRTRGTRILPYVNGFNFCLHYAEKPAFASFFAEQISLPDFGMSQLLTVWEWHQARLQRMAGKADLP
ncbi:MAG: hypothetical protein IT578_06290 [Verrucomicrobiae bacterium]|nr:hypothetical protein [Verrucomicrobiae bacterium]